MLFVAFFASIVVGLEAYCVAYMALSPDEGAARRPGQRGSWPVHRFLAHPEPRPRLRGLNASFGYALGFTLLAYATHIGVWVGDGGMFSGAGGAG